MHSNAQHLSFIGSIPSRPQPRVDFTAIKARQQSTWACADFSVIGATLQIVGETLCEAVELRSGARVLDVACGSGNAALAAARRFCQVSGVDYVPALIERARERAAAERLTVDFATGDAESLPYDNGEFDFVLSTFGASFAPRQEVTANELLRVCRRGGRIGMANWTPLGFIGEMFRVVGSFVPPPAGVPSMLNWGDETALKALFGERVTVRGARRSTMVFRYRSAEHWLAVFREHYGPTKRAFEALDARGKAELETALRELAEKRNRDLGGLALPAEYLEVVLEKH